MPPPVVTALLWLRLCVAQAFITQVLLLVCVLLLNPQTVAAKSCSTTDEAEEFALRFELREAAVLDRKTGLLWQRCSVGQKLVKNQCHGTARLLGLAEAQELAKNLPKGWRLPSLSELATLRKTNCKGPQINRYAFPGLTELSEGKAKYWSTSRDKLLPSLRYNLDFLTGEIDANTAGIPMGVRFVRSVDQD